MSGIFGMPFEVKETQCLTQRDEACSFEVAMLEAPVSGLSSRTSSKVSQALP